MSHRQREHDDETARQRHAQQEQLREQRDELAASKQQQEAVRIVQAAVQRQAERMGKTVGAQAMEHVAEKARERFEQDPRAVDQVLSAEAKRIKEAKEAGRDDMRDVAHEVHRDRRLEREERARAAQLQAQQEQDHNRAGRELERTR
ncbi:hypothetical protein GUF72_21460 [Xanthomonas citri pv. citri]|nr:hypothetical protein [Xanthomonas citri pv. citri]MBD1528454.1 hypothetical protein [Xanthomonas citri pv. citri]MBD1536549.1 hypothetical protein [Xanthomonas citri pv. citri]MBD1563959.1 hypothetical protein [Xanthomonas citri pv. citri]MBD4670395.1 hypothetical protein [Xanthomonas citri pv. citri]